MAVARLPATLDLVLRVPIVLQGNSPVTDELFASPEVSPPRLWLRPHLVSFDAPVVALLWQALSARTFHAGLHWPAYVALGGAVWIIYVADRLLDSMQPDEANLSSRHRFYRANRGLFVVLTIAAVSGLAISCRFLNPWVLRNGIVLAILVAFYFVLVHAAPPRLQRTVPKELMVGLIFSSGVCLATWTKIGSLRDLLLAPAILLGILCWINCVAIESWEWKHLRDTAGAPPHALTRWTATHLTAVCIAVAGGSLALGAFEQFRPIAAAGVLSAAGFIWLNQQSTSLSIDAVRVLADVVLLTPALFLIFH